MRSTPPSDAAPPEPVACSRPHLLRRFDYALIGVCLLALIATTLLYAVYLGNSEMRWATPDNDRNAHYLAALKIGTDIRALDVARLFDDFRKVRTWPPLHAIVIGLTSAVVGPDYRLAVLPNVIAWGCGIVLTFALTRRLLSVGGNLAGLLAATFYFASPSHRAFATDFMLEAIGSMLTLLCLWAYVRYRQQADTTLRMLTLALTLLFFEKYNYWLLVLLAMGLTEAWDRRRVLWAKLVDARAFAWSAWLRKHALAIATLCLPVVAGVGYVAFAASTGKVSQHQNLAHFVLIALVLRVALCWRWEGRLVWQRLSAPMRTLGLGHGLPIIIWFLLPKRLGYFLWYIGPTQGANVNYGWKDSINFYWAQATEWYFVAPWLAVVATLLVLVAVAYQSRLKPGAIAVLMLLGVSLFLTLKHPNQKTRFLHTWIPAVWILSGVGAVAIGQVLGRSTHRSGALIASGALAAILVVPQLSVGYGMGGSPESGHRPCATSLAVSRAYLPWISDSESVAILGTLPIDYFSEWTYLSTYPHHARPYTAANMMWWGKNSESNAAQFRNWLDQHHPERIVLVDIESNSSLNFPDFEHFRQFRELIAAQHDYVPARSTRVDELGCQVTLWERKSAEQQRAVDNSSTVRR